MMTENETAEQTSGAYFNTIVAIAIAFIALVGSVITKVQGDVSTFSSIAGNDEQMYYYQAMGKQISGDANSNNEFGTIYQLWYEYNLLAKSAEKNGDQASAASYRNLRDDLVKNSDLLGSEYFDPVKGRVDLAAYKSDKYGLEIIELVEKQSAAADVVSAWDEKASAFVLQLTLLAVAGFLLGLALMTKSRIARLIFTWSGIPMVIVISIWAYLVWIQPVYDLRETGAIPYFAQGASLIEQNHWKDALDPLSQAIELAGEEFPYGHAYLLRAEANAKLGNFEAAVLDFQSAVDAGEDDPNVAGSLVWALFQTGKFQQAVDAGRTALSESPDDLWLQLHVGIALLANGEIDSARMQYQSAKELAIRNVAQKRALGADPSEIWWQLKEAAFQLGNLEKLLTDEAVHSAVKDAIVDPLLVAQSAREFGAALNESSVALEYGVDPSEVKAKFDAPAFSLTTTEDQAYVFGVDAVIKYEGMEKGQLFVLKVLRNGIENPSWTYTEMWDRPVSGKFTFALTPSYSDVYLVSPGEYEVTIYVNGKLLRSGKFVVEDNDPAAETDDDASFIFSDMLDEFDFLNLDIFDNDEEADEDMQPDPTEFFDQEEEYDFTPDDEETTGEEEEDIPGDSSEDTGEGSDPSGGSSDGSGEEDVPPDEGGEEPPPDEEE